MIWNGKGLLAVAFGCAIVFVSTSVWSINIDGLLDEAEWSQAQIVVLDHVVEPFGLANSPHKTTAKILSLEDGIYIAVVNWQHSESQRQEKKPRASETFADKNQIIIDFDNAGLVAYGFEISNGGTMRGGIGTFLSYLSEVNNQNFAAGSFKIYFPTFYRNSEIAGQDDVSASVEEVANL